MFKRVEQGTEKYFPKNVFYHGELINYSSTSQTDQNRVFNYNTEYVIYIYDVCNRDSWTWLSELIYKLTWKAMFAIFSKTIIKLYRKRFYCIFAQCFLCSL